MIIYKVYNKAFEIHFDNKQKAEDYISMYGSATVGFDLTEIYVF